MKTVTPSVSEPLVAQQLSLHALLEVAVSDAIYRPPVRARLQAYTAASEGQEWCS